jgi:phosphoribosylformylglycinamidine synthase
MDYSGLVLSHGICPRYSDLDAGKMADAALDEAIRNCVAVGADPAHIAVLDNFSWPDPVFHAEKNPDGPYKLAQLDKACKQLHDSAIALGTPFISGKDSMKNDYRIAGRKISVPPTLLVTALGRISDIRQAVSMDVKDAGHTVYVLGDTHAELGASELMADLGRPLEGICPGYDPERARRCYEALHTCMQEGWIASCHDCSDGGLAVALAESAFAGGFGMHLDLRCLQKKGLSGTETLFSESLGRLVFTAAPEACASIENRLQGLPLFRLGQSIEENELRIELEGETHAVCETLSDLKTAWQRRL